MPIYKCNNCQNIFETVYKSNECPYCGNEDIFVMYEDDVSEKVYCWAKELLDRNTETSLELARESLKTIKGYKDVNQLINKCEELLILSNQKKTNSELKREQKKSLRTDNASLTNEANSIKQEKAEQGTIKFSKKMIAVIAAVLLVVLAAIILPTLNTKQSGESEIISDNIEVQEIKNYQIDAEKHIYIANNHEYEYVENLNEAQVYDYILLGEHNGPILWKVIAKEDGRLLVTSEFIVDKKPYNIGEEIVQWEDCGLRIWMNNDLYNTAFTEEEKMMISPNCNGDMMFIYDLETLFKYPPNADGFSCKRHLVTMEYNQPGFEHINENYMYWLSDVKTKNQWSKEMKKNADLNYYFLNNEWGEGDAINIMVDIQGKICFENNMDIECGVRPLMWICPDRKTDTLTVGKHEFSYVKDIKNAYPSDLICFGQAGKDDVTPMLWEIIDRSNEGILATTRFIYDESVCFDKIDNKWDTSYLKKWLNETWDHCFKQIHFLNREQTKLLTVENSEHITIYSEELLEKHPPKSGIKCYSYRELKYSNALIANAYWLKNPYTIANRKHLSIVEVNGDVCGSGSANYHGRPDEMFCGVRPVIRISLK